MGPHRMMDTIGSGVRLQKLQVCVGGILGCPEPTDLWLQDPQERQGELAAATPPERFLFGCPGPFGRNSGDCVQPNGGSQLKYMIAICLFLGGEMALTKLNTNLGRSSKLPMFVRQNCLFRKEERFPRHVWILKRVRRECSLHESLHSFGD